MLSGEFELFHFSETVNDKSVGFDYKLKKGKLKSRNAIRILEINNCPKVVINNAMGISKKLDKTYLVKSTDANRLDKEESNRHNS